MRSTQARLRRHTALLHLSSFRRDYTSATQASACSTLAYEAEK